jgi:DNA-binding NtrC family response regulator
VLLASRPEIIGNSRAMKKTLGLIDRVAVTDETVLLVGETGTGKDELALLVHWLSGRREKPFINLDCVRLNSLIAESVLYGHVKGAFTGAFTDSPGVCRAADRGSLLLTEFQRTKREGQRLLLQALDGRGFAPMGSQVNARPDFRLIVASANDPSQLVADGKMDEHLFYRLRCLPIQVPALRERLDDIPALLAHASALAIGRPGIRDKRWTLGAVNRLYDYDWPGNVRQFQAVVTMALVYSSEQVDRELVDQILGYTQVDNALEGLDTLEKKRLVLKTHEELGSITATAKKLRRSTKTISRYLRQELEPIPESSQYFDSHPIT